MASMKIPGPAAPVLALVILDGWGIGRDEPGNAILAANTPTMDHLLASYPHTTLACSGEAVGLPDGQMGNSEVGHMNLGAGFVVYQWLTRIDRAITDGSLAGNDAFQAACAAVKRSGGTLHLMGLVSDGGVHSHIRHLVALLRLAVGAGVTRIAVHAFTDGRDTSPTSGRRFVAELQQTLDRLGYGRIATVSGRYYAMDRDHRWDRTKLAFDAVVHGVGQTAATAEMAVANAYASGVTDEFIVPTVIPGSDGRPTGIDAGDQVIAFNFRADRLRQLTAAMVDRDFTGFDRGPVPPVIPVTTMTRYDAHLPMPVIFPPHDVEFPLARVLSDAGMTQFHCAETEKYAHVTYFFNGGREDAYPGESRSMVASPKVATYDLQPEMSAIGVTDQVVAAIASGKYRFVIVNFANCDMVGHTGVFAAAVRAAETVDGCLARILAAVSTQHGVALVTADHGNAEEMIDRETGGPMTAHTTNPVPIVLVTPDGHPLRNAELHGAGILSSVAPTVLRLLGIAVPPAMTSTPLV
jgi:2,3-bisphosphoglycerate-independent phosphoglycerate mutase